MFFKKHIICKNLIYISFKFLIIIDIFFIVSNYYLSLFLRLLLTLIIIKYMLL